MTELVLSTLPTHTYFTEVDGPTDSEVAVGTEPYPNKQQSHQFFLLDTLSKNAGQNQERLPFLKCKRNLFQ